jgi:hypothetical protein
MDDKYDVLTSKYGHVLCDGEIYVKGKNTILLEL